MGRMVTSEKKCCEVCDQIASLWELGGINVGAVEEKSAQYVAGYIMKKMTSMQDLRLNGRWPEYHTMSKIPALGTGAMWEVASKLMQYDLEHSLPDVPTTLQFGKKHLPLGRTLRKKLRVMMGRPETMPETERQRLHEEKVLPLLILGKSNKEGISVKAQVVESRKTQAASLKSIQQIYGSKKRDIDDEKK